MYSIPRRHFLIRSAVGGSGFLMSAALFPSGFGAEPKTEQKHLELRTRRRVESAPGSAQFQVVENLVTWPARETALIICDMWDRHWCEGATRRVKEVAPRMNQLAAEVRRRGALVIHAPSSCMDFYRSHPARRRAQSAPAAAQLPSDIKNWCNQIPSEEKGKYPIDQTDGGCDDLPKCPGGSPWKRQIDLLEIRDEDAISDSGIEIWNLLAARAIQNVMILGVHTNMCVLGRPFGLRQMSVHGKNTVLIRDLTDTMYNSRAWPFVNHFQGTDLIVEHIEKFVCPTTTSVSILGGAPFRFREDQRPSNG